MIDKMTDGHRKVNKKAIVRIGENAGNSNMGEVREQEVQRTYKIDYLIGRRLYNICLKNMRRLEGS